MAEKKKFTRVISPIGKAVFPRINEPSTKFNADGTYECNILLDPNDEDATWMLNGVEQTGVQNFLNLLDAKADEGFAQSKVDFKEAKKTAKTKAKRDAKFEVKRRDPFDIELDDEGKETGLVLVKTRVNAVYRKKNDDGTETIFRKKPGIFDSQGKPFDSPIWGGTKLRIQFSLDLYVMLSQSDAGATKRLGAVQVLSLVGPGQMDAEAYGFGAVEGGFEYQEEKKDDDSDNNTDGEDYGSPDGAEGEEPPVEDSLPADGSEESNKGGKVESKAKPVKAKAGYNF